MAFCSLLIPQQNVSVGMHFSGIYIEIDFWYSPNKQKHPIEWSLSFFLGRWNSTPKLGTNNPWSLIPRHNRYEMVRHHGAARHEGVDRKGMEDRCQRNSCVVVVVVVVVAVAVVVVLVVVVVVCCCCRADQYSVSLVRFRIAAFSDV